VKYTILGQRFGTERVGEICQCDSNPGAIVAAAAARRIFIGKVGKRKVFVAKYEHVHFVENTSLPAAAE
jgi:hypothetical protein